MSVLVVRVIPFFFFIWADKSVIPIVPLQKKILRDILSNHMLLKRDMTELKVSEPGYTALAVVTETSLK